MLVVCGSLFVCYCVWFCCSCCVVGMCAFVVVAGVGCSCCWYRCRCCCRCRWHVFVVAVVIVVAVEVAVAVASVVDSGCYMLIGGCRFEGVCWLVSVAYCNVCCVPCDVWCSLVAI